VAGGKPQQGDRNDFEQAGPERERLIAAFGKAAAEHGYRDLSFDRVARYAGISQARIGDYFATKDEGLFAAQDAFLERLWTEALDSCGTAEEWPQRVRAAIQSVVATLVEASNLARVFIVEATGVSLAAAERQFALLDRFAELLGEGRAHYSQAAQMPPTIERALIGGVASIISAHLLAEEPQALADTQPELVELLLIPFLGKGGAAEVARS
jgi:AcrR family transcriptional regulator